MEYEIETTTAFDKWFSKIKDKKVKARFLSRIDYLRMGVFGDHKQLDSVLFELRFFFGAGFRIYYTIREDVIILLINGGDKSSQKKDIKKAQDIIKDLQ